MKRVLFVILLTTVLGERVWPAPAEFSVVAPESHDVLEAHGRGDSPEPGQVLALRSRSAGVGVVGFAEVVSVRLTTPGEFVARVRVLRLSPHVLVQPGDRLAPLDLSSAQSDYRGNTVFLVHSRWRNVSARYRPLYTQGISIGETAATLGEDEYLAGLYGQFGYGVRDWLSAGSILPAVLLGSPNANLKARLVQTDNNTVSLGLTVTKIRDESATALNLNLFWDSVTSARMTTHTLITFAVATLEKFEDTVAIKTAGTSSLQTGYEVLLENWDRVLFGPSYNFETRTLGGYVAYKRIWDKTHLSASLSTVDIRELKYSPKTGYVGLIEAYWRF